MKYRQALIAVFIAVFILTQVLPTFQLKSNSPQPPANYANNPPDNLNCTYCHTGVPIHDSTNFVLSIGTDTSNFTTLTSGTTYQLNQVYYLRMQANKVHPRYGFELTAQDASNSGTDIGSFTVLNNSNTSFVNTGTGLYVAHKNADANNQWTFKWTAPATNIGPITFYWAGNDANGDTTQEGDSIYVVKKTISATPGAAINNISSVLTNINISPAVCSTNLQLQFEVLNRANVQAQIIALNGALIQTVLNENLSAGTFHHVVDVNSLAAGIYLLKVQAGDGFAVKKFIRQ
jgi:Reeler domain/Secretion system C-terminal sorting domain